MTAMSKSKIEWTESTWNPITGCTKASSGCAHCYAEVMARRLKGMHKPKYQNGFALTLHPEDLDEPRSWKKGRNIFVCSMSDLFHENVPFDFIDRVMKTIRETPQHRYQLLTKRGERMAEYFATREVSENVWLGVTVECQATRSRIDALRNVPATVRFLSCEPLVEDLGELNLSGIDWVIVGGESGPKARPMKEEWVLNIKRQVEAEGAAFFFKQWGTAKITENRQSIDANLLNGVLYHNLPQPKQ